MFVDGADEDWEGKVRRCAYCGKSYDQSSGYTWVCSEACSDAMSDTLNGPSSEWRL